MTLRLRSGQASTVTGLITSLTLWDVVAMNIVAVVGLRWISRSARLGAPSVTLWILACLLFFVPLAAVIAELSSRHPEQGGAPGVWLIAGGGLLATLIAMGLVFVPPPGTENVLNYEVNLIGQAAVLIGIGMGVYLTARR